MEMSQQSHNDRGPGFDMPELGPYLPQMIDEFMNYLRQVIPEMMPRMREDPDRLDELISLVEEEMWAEGGPNMDGFFDLVKQMEFTDEQLDQMMNGIKTYMRQLMSRILEESGFEGDAQEVI
jgi:hypothetical protein